MEKQDFDEAMRLTKCSKESTELSVSKGNVNPLDVVYDLLGDLIRRGNKDDDGWVEIAQVINMAAHKTLSRDQVIEALDSWADLSVLHLNPEKTMVKFTVPP